MTKWVYAFGDGRSEGDQAMKALLGGKGADLAEMSRLGLPVPPDFHHHRSLRAATQGKMPVCRPSACKLRNSWLCRQPAAKTPKSPNRIRIRQENPVFSDVK
jgi:hypothetical protein